MTFLKRLLCFFRLVDPHDGLISLTNLMMILVTVKLGFSKTTSLTDLGAFLCAIANYTAKKVINQGAGPQPSPCPSPGAASAEAR